MSNKTLDIVDNFAKIKDVKSNLLYGRMIDDADVTIGIPVYGFGPFFEESLNSVLNQKESGLSVQIIVGDNKDYGESPNPFVEYFEKRNIPNLAYFCTEKPLNQLSNFNRLIELCRTKYLAMIHDDDLLAPDYLLNLSKLKTFLARNDIGMIHGKYEFFSGTAPKFGPNSKIAVYRINRFIVDCVGSSCTGIPSCGYLINCEIMKSVGGFNDTFASSGDAFPSAIMMNKGYKVYNFKYTTGFYRVANNASLKLNICRGFVEQDYMFYQDWKSCGGLFRKMMMGFFQNYHYSRNIEGKVFTFSSLNKEITIENLDYLGKYKKYHKFGFHNLVQHFFWYLSQFSKAIGLIKFN